MNSPNTKNYTILIVDDLVENLVLLSNFIEKFGYENTFAKNGKEAIASVEKNKPDLILLDLMMPVMNGLECCQKLKADPNSRDIPIIFITASLEEKHLIKALELGGNDYVTKPLKKNELRTRINNQLTMYQQIKELKETKLQLKLANKKLTYFKDTIGNNNGNPLSNIKECVRVLQEKLPRQLDSPEQKILETIEEEVNKIDDSIDSLI